MFHMMSLNYSSYALRASCCATFQFITIYLFFCFPHVGLGCFALQTRPRNSRTCKRVCVHQRRWLQFVGCSPGFRNRWLTYNVVFSSSVVVFPLVDLAVVPPQKELQGLTTCMRLERHWLAVSIVHICPLLFVSQPHSPILVGY